MKTEEIMKLIEHAEYWYRFHTQHGNQAAADMWKRTLDKLLDLLKGN